MADEDLRADVAEESGDASSSAVLVAAHLLPEELVPVLTEVLNQDPPQTG